MAPQPKALPLFRVALVLLSIGFVPVQAAVSGRAADRQAVAADPAVAIALQSTGTGTYRFVATNPGSVPVYYSGYEDGFPVYTVEIFRGGAWQKGKRGWCGVGLGECSVGPKKSIERDVRSGISFEINTGERFRIAMDFSPERQERHTGARYRAGRTVYSNELRFTPPPPPPENPFLRSFPKKG